MKFKLTHHASRRIKERKMTNPSKLNLRLPGKKYRALIRRKCNKNGFSGNYIYFINHSSRKPVYICYALGIGDYLVITAFNLKDEWDF